MDNIKIIDVRDLLEHKNASYLFDKYAEESRSELVPKHKPDDKLYHTLQDQGMLDCIVAYDGEDIVGFIVAMTVKIPHYSELSTTIESVFVLKEHRRYGTGIKLIKKAEQLAIDRGSKMFFISAPIDSKLNNILSRSGMTAISTVYTKNIS